MLIWAIQYILLGWLVVFLNPVSINPFKNRKQGIQILLITAGLYIAYQSPVWMRNFVLADEGRKVYSFANRDVSRRSFYTQEINTILYCVLLAAIWVQWSAFLERRRRVLAEEASQDPIEAVINAASIRRLSFTFLHWQATSVLLGIAFIFFTRGFWELVFTEGDHRYIVPALSIHVIWGITWCLVSLPLLITWFAWQSHRLQAIEALESNPPTAKDTVEIKLKCLNEAKPVDFWNVAASGVVAVGSFLWPILKPLIFG